MATEAGWCMCSASVRRTSMREKKAMSMKEAREEAQKLLESANVPVSADDDDDEAKLNAVNGPPSTSAVTVCTPSSVISPPHPRFVYVTRSG